MDEPQRREAHEADFTFTIGDMEPDVLKVTAFRGTEGVSELFHFRIEVCSELQLPEFSELVGAAAKLQIATDSGTRYVRGIISSFERTGRSRTRNYAAAELVPLHWLLCFLGRSGGSRARAREAGRGQESRAGQKGRAGQEERARQEARREEEKEEEAQASEDQISLET